MSSVWPEMAEDWQTPRTLAALAKLRESNSFDAVWAVRVWAGEACRRVGFRNIVVDVDDVPSCYLSDWVKGQRLPVWRQIDLLKTKAYEFALPYRFERLVVCKDDDLSAFGGSRSNVRCVPNGVSARPWLSAEREAPGELLFVGALDWFPNVEALRWFVGAVLPRLREARPDCRLVVVGRGAAPEVERVCRAEGCTLVGFASDLEPYYKSAAVVVVPILSGSGTRLKVLEALAYGKAVVTTPRGCDGLGLRNGVHAAVADTAEGFSVAVLALLEDRALRRRLGGEGRAHVRRSFSPEHVSRAVQGAVSGLLPATREGLDSGTAG